jgi:D-3-phosphoglycerate dehydrogenase
MIGEEQLRSMKPTAYLINTARGGLVNEPALTKALRDGWIAGAASDAFIDEPPSGSPLLQLDNFVASPHVGASTDEAVERVSVMASQNAILVLQGERPTSVLNPSVYETEAFARRHDRQQL